MSTQCEHYRNLIADAVTGSLDAALSRQLDEHLAACADCRGYYESLKCEDLLLGQFVEKIDRDMAGRQQRLVNALKHHEHKQTRHTLNWRFTMKSPMTKMAAAAAVIIAVGVGVILFPSGNVTWADVVKPILTAKTIILDMVVGADETSPLMHEIIVGTRIRRTLSNMPALTQILDLESGNMLVLDSEAKSAAVVAIQGVVAEGTKDYIAFLRQVIRQVQEGQVQKLGEKVVDGRQAVGFVGKGQNEAVTIWADARTAQPIRIEFTLGQDFSVIMKNFRFDAPVDAALVSMDPPAGYTLAPTNFDLSDATEDDFIKSLRIWAEIVSDGAFPDTIGTEKAVQQMPVLVQKLTQMDISEEQGTEIAMRFARGMLFHQIINRQGKWHYAGAGVRLGDAQTPIFWYQPRGSATYRVIRGDLTVRDVAPEDLPK